MEHLNPKVKTKLYPNLNHLFQHAQTGAVSEYSTIEGDRLTGSTPGHSRIHTYRRITRSYTLLSLSVLAVLPLCA